jgi:hypothetical protein
MVRSSGFGVQSYRIIQDFYLIYRPASLIFDFGLRILDWELARSLRPVNDLDEDHVI